MNRIAIERLYEQACLRASAIAAHLPRLRRLSTGLDVAIEFGVKQASSSLALLLGAKHVISYDIIATPQARNLEPLAGDAWEYRLMDSRVAPITPCDLLFIDSLHTYAQVSAELSRHADSVRQYLVFHDVLTFGSIGAMGESGRHLWTPGRGKVMPLSALGIRPAIDDLMVRDPSWRVEESYTDSHGLLVLRRRS